MLTQFLVLRLAMVSLVASGALPGSPRAINAKHAIQVRDGSRAVRVGVTLDNSLVNLADEHEIRTLGRRGRYILIVDSYVSRPEGLSRCRSGNERYVRVIDLPLRRELFSKLAESCHKDVVPGDPIANWNNDASSLTVNLVSEPSIAVRLTADGNVTSRPLVEH